MARRKEFDPDKVLDKAIDLFWQQGYEATSVQELVEHLGIGRGSLYDTFGDKHSLFLAALDRYRTQRHAAFMVALDQPGPVKPLLRQFFVNIVDETIADARRRGCLITNTTLELASHDREVSDRISANQDSIEETLYQTLLRAEVAGELPARHSPRALARFLFNALQGLRVMAKANPEEQTLQDIIEVTLSVLD